MGSKYSGRKLKDLPGSATSTLPPWRQPYQAQSPQQALQPVQASSSYQLDASSPPAEPRGIVTIDSTEEKEQQFRALAIDAAASKRQGSGPAAPSSLPAGSDSGNERRHPYAHSSLADEQDVS